jgi:hypothetical protein
VPEIVTLRSWLGWLLLGQARASRRAYERAARSDDWAKDMTDDDQRAMNWASEEEEDVQ